MPEIAAVRDLELVRDWEAALRLLSAPPQAWYLMNDASTSGLLNDNTGNNNTASPGSYGGGGQIYLIAPL